MELQALEQRAISIRLDSSDRGDLKGSGRLLGSEMLSDHLEDTGSGEKMRVHGSDSERRKCGP